MNTYRTGSHHYVNRVYEGTRPVASFYNSFEADRFVEAMNRTDVVKPGHVQVRVDDLAGRIGAHPLLDTRAWTAWQWWLKQQTESHKEPASSETLTDSGARNLPTVGYGCECWVVPENMWTTYCGAVELSSQVKYNPDCPKHAATGPAPDFHRESDAASEIAESSQEAVVSLPCRDCGVTITQTVRLALDHVGQVLFTFPRDDRTRHTCTPVEPARLMHPEPTQRGAKATFTFHERGVLELLRFYGNDRVWQDQYGTPWTWEALTDMDGDDRSGSLTLGWGDDQ